MINVTESNFADQVNTGTALVDFYADWCGPCKMMAPVLEAVEFEEGLPVLKVNVDEHPGLAREYGVMSIPTLVLFKDGEPVQTIVGAKPKKELVKLLDL